jgi:alpha 1,3-glucosidase
MLKHAVVALLAAVVTGVDHGKFRLCNQTGFCARNRPGTNQDYAVITNAVKLDDATNTVTLFLANKKHPLQQWLECSLNVVKNDVLRMSVKESAPTVPRWEVSDVLQNISLESSPFTLKASETSSTLSFGNKKFTITHYPFCATLSMDGEDVMTLNGDNLMNFEVTRQERNPRPADDEALQSDADMMYDYDVENMWEESFGGHIDTKPHGPQAVALDVSFSSNHIYGLPEHASSFSLKTTPGTDAKSDPYRLYNLDVFEYELDEPMALYGAVPLVVAHDESKTSALLWLNAAETFVDVAEGGGGQGKKTHWMSETGVIDLFLMADKEPKAVLAAYAELTGLPAMPQQFAVAYHQCRWNYKSETDVTQVDSGFDENDIPYDVLWLDIEHTDGKKYFTWDSHNFPSPEKMQNGIASKGRKMVTIIDPHIKRDNDYHVHTAAQTQGLYVKNKDGVDFEGWCWPGSVSYLDFYRPEVRNFWAGLFSLEKYAGSTPSLFTWNDMNEPSVFNGPEVTMQKDSLHLGGLVEHRAVHNM